MCIDAAGAEDVLGDGEDAYDAAGAEPDTVAGIDSGSNTGSGSDGFKALDGFRVPNRFEVWVSANPARCAASAGAM